MEEKPKKKLGTAFWVFFFVAASIAVGAFMDPDRLKHVLDFWVDLITNLLI